MIKNLKVKAVIIVAVILLCIYGIIGFPTSKAKLAENLSENIRLGLDLKGGSHLVLQVQVQDAFKVEADQAIERLKEALRRAGVQYASVDRSDPTSIQEADHIQINIRGVQTIQSGTLRSTVAESLPSWNLAPVSSTDYRLTLKQTEALKLRQDTVTQSIHTIERRINGLGLAESAVQQRGRADAEAEILVQLPGVDDPARIRQILQTTAMLELYEVKDGPFGTQQDALAKHGGVLPLNTKLVRAAPRGESGDGWYLLTRTPVITGRDLRDSRAAQGEFGRWETTFVLTQDAARRFGRFTEQNIGNRLAIVLDNQVLSAPTIQNRIEDSGRITGAASQQEAADLALNLRAGSLPAGIVPLQEQTVGPSLGADSIRQGIIAGLAGLFVIIAIMLFYYRGAGVNATLALLLNAVMLIAAMAWLGATLTLPGIAGVILTIGMAVDSNILIFERIREELRAGKAVVAAMEAGFSRAFLTIIDTHVTTVISCAFLFIFGSGPVKGFAVTLVIGLAANLFTAVFFSKSLFEFKFSRQRQVTSLSI
ncbi:MAG: protein translocase subunit SecD [Bryobacterales bacterium]|nr:protein translocase subunit SecD [Bryobacterales bacterium]MEB2360692.1 protein translocase subunit SecD [Bryobacterales bacterium]